MPDRGLYGFWSRRLPFFDTPCSFWLAGVLRPVFHQGGVGGGRPSPKCLKYQNPEKNGGSNLFRETAGQIQNHFCHRSRPSRSCATDKIPPPAAHRSSRSRGTRHLLQLNHAISSKNRPSSRFQIKAKKSQFSSTYTHDKGLYTQRCFAYKYRFWMISTKLSFLQILHCSRLLKGQTRPFTAELSHHLLSATLTTRRPSQAKSL